MRLFLLLALVLSGFFVVQGAEASFASSPPELLLRAYGPVLLYVIVIYPLYALTIAMRRLFHHKEGAKTIRRSYLERGCLVLFFIPLLFSILPVAFSFIEEGYVREIANLGEIIFLFMFIPAVLHLLYKVIPSFLEKKGKNGNRLRLFVHDRFFTVYPIVLVLYVIMILVISYIPVWLHLYTYS